MYDLIGKKVMHRVTKARGVIKCINNNKMTVSFDEEESTYLFPAAFAEILLLEDETMQERYVHSASEANFDNFKETYINAVNMEIGYLKQHGGKRYRIIDGERMITGNDTFVYLFETDSELHFPEGTSIKLWLSDRIIPAQVVSCEEFNIIFQSVEYIGDKIETIEFTAEPWQLLEGLVERLQELKVDESPVVYELACKGLSKKNPKKMIKLGQDLALKQASTQPITFIWGPPGTGKTTTLAKVALEYILKGKRVLMLSYSNVSVDGALLKIAEMSDYEPGQIIRYGYPRVRKLLESETLTSYSYVLHKNKELASVYNELMQERSRLNSNNPRRIEIRKMINKIRVELLEKEKQLIHESAFIATTVSKAIVDKALYLQKFDMVVFDEASMAYVPQIIFAASLTKENFCCLGDFRQLPAIVQNPGNTLLMKDIFEYTGITSAVENGYSHDWLVMLNYQYRMHPQIASFVGKYMYENLLQSSEKIYEHCQMIADLSPAKSKPMSLIDLSSTYSVCIKTGDSSRINLMSAMICVKLAELYSDLYDVGIITPYNAQARLVLAMIRDLQERNLKFSTISCATVHQFQGSEKPIIIYDAVDCFRMSYPGTLLTSQKNDTANRLFNVALTRTQGKFILVANKDYLFRKKISKDLMFTRMLELLNSKNISISGENIFEEIGTAESEDAEVFLGDRDEVDSWERYLEDLRNASSEIFIDMPGCLDDDIDALNDFIHVLRNVEDTGVSVYIRIGESVTLPNSLAKYSHKYAYVTTPFTIIDKEKIWFGEPLSSANFLSEGNVLETKCFPCMKFAGRHTARMLKAIFEIPNCREK